MEQKPLYRSTPNLVWNVVSDIAFLGSGWLTFFWSFQTVFSSSSSPALDFLSVTFGTIWLCATIFLIRRTWRNFRSGRVRALVASDRIEVVSFSGKRVAIPWANVRYIEADDDKAYSRRKTIYIHHAEKGRRRVQALDLLPASPEEIAAFLAALRQNWPDMDKPWQEQLQYCNAD